VPRVAWVADHRVIRTGPAEPDTSGMGGQISESLLLTFLSTNPGFSADFGRSGVENATLAFENGKNPRKTARKVNNRL
jgi:hypothetical protein